MNQIEQEEEMDASLESLSARVKGLEDLEEIRITWRDYCMRLDSGDWPALGDVFTEDAVLEMDGLDALNCGLDGEYCGRKSIINDFYVRAVGALVAGEEGLHSTWKLENQFRP